MIMFQNLKKIFYRKLFTKNENCAQNRRKISDFICVLKKYIDGKQAKYISNFTFS